MRACALLCLLLVSLAFPQTLSAQNFGVGARIGTLGFGGEAALGLSDQFVVRGGIGSFVLDFNGDYGDVTYTISPPSLTGTLGMDFYPAGGLRLMAGLMFRRGDFTMESGDLAGAGGITIGDNEYTEGGTLTGTMATRSTAPFVGLGFGHHTQGDFGFFLDLGVAFVGDPEVSMEGQGAIASVPGFQEDLDKEAQKIQDEAATYLKYWPILSVGVKIPLG